MTVIEHDEHLMDVHIYEPGWCRCGRPEGHWLHSEDLDLRIEPFIDDYVAGTYGPGTRLFLRFDESELPKYVTWTTPEGYRDTSRLKAVAFEVTGIVQRRALNEARLPA